MPLINLRSRDEREKYNVTEKKGQMKKKKKKKTKTQTDALRVLKMCNDNT